MIQTRHTARRLQGFLAARLQRGKVNSSTLGARRPTLNPAARCAVFTPLPGLTAAARCQSIRPAEVAAPADIPDTAGERRRVTLIGPPADGRPPIPGRSRLHDKRAPSLCLLRGCRADGPTDARHGGVWSASPDGRRSLTRTRQGKTNTGRVKRCRTTTRDGGGLGAAAAAVGNQFCSSRRHQ